MKNLLDVIFLKSSKGQKLNWLFIIGVFFVFCGVRYIFIDFSESITPIILGAIVAVLGWFKKKREIDKEASKSDKIEKFYVTGTAYYKSNIAKLAVSNPDWKSTKAKLIKDGKADEEIYRFSYVNKPVKLIPEPTNEHDPNAIMVLFAGEKVGYISRADNKKVKYILDEGKIEYISGFIGGGEYKFINADGELEKDERPFSISVTISYFG